MCISTSGVEVTNYIYSQQLVNNNAISSKITSLRVEKKKCSSLFASVCVFEASAAVKFLLFIHVCDVLFFCEETGCFISGA